MGIEMQEEIMPRRGSGIEMPGGRYGRELACSASWGGDTGK